MHRNVINDKSIKSKAKLKAEEWLPNCISEKNVPGAHLSGHADFTV